MAKVDVVTRKELGETFRVIAARLRSRARWLTDPTNGTSAKNAAVQDALEGVADELDSMASEFES